METSREWNERVQSMVQRGSGCDGLSVPVLNTLSMSVPIMEGASSSGRDADGNSSDHYSATRTSESSQNWIERFVNQASLHPRTTSKIISQLNEYHRQHGSGSLAGIDSKRGGGGAAAAAATLWRSTTNATANGTVRNEVTPPSGALKSPGEESEKDSGSAKHTPRNQHPGNPPPLLLSRSSPAVSNNNTDRSSLLPSLAPTTTTKKGVPHIYHDYSNVPDALNMVRKKTGGVTQPFPEKLHTMLDNDDDPSVVGWLPHGRAFLVRKPAEFITKIMPKYFRQTKLTSFQRQLNLYGFRRLTQGVDAGAYYHELFLRGRPQLCLRMQRQKIKGTGHKQPADVQTEPNFYNMAPSQTCGPSKPKKPKSLASASVAAVAAAPVPALSHSAPQPFGDAMFQSDSFAHLSPGSRGVQSAANLLKGLKRKHCGKSRSQLLHPHQAVEVGSNKPPTTTSMSMSSTVSVSEPNLQLCHRSSSPTSSLSTTHSSNHGSSPILANTTYELYLTKQRSMSLLGRVQQNFSKPGLKKQRSLSGITEASGEYLWPHHRNNTMGGSSGGGSPGHNTTATFESSSTTFSPSHPPAYLQLEIDGGASHPTNTGDEQWGK
mmetsp:Transcript_19364/g.44892  ORF Transcript_19364/g.44892 Transcript_19364/m.44892 type:complete len:603 (+) Transcript_19364:203-2011(+)